MDVNLNRMESKELKETYKSVSAIKLGNLRKHIIMKTNKTNQKQEGAYKAKKDTLNPISV